MSEIPLSFCARSVLERYQGPVISYKPLSAQAQTPSRPSGAGKKQAANKQGGQRGRDRGGGQGHLPKNPINLAANQHCQTLVSVESSVKTVDGWLPGALCELVLDEYGGGLQWGKMVRRVDLTPAA